MYLIFTLKQSGASCLRILDFVQQSLLVSFEMHVWVGNFSKTNSRLNLEEKQKLSIPDSFQGLELTIPQGKAMSDH